MRNSIPLISPKNAHHAHTWPEKIVQKTSGCCFSKSSCEQGITASEPPRPCEKNQRAKKHTFQNCTLGPQDHNFLQSFALGLAQKPAFFAGCVFCTVGAFPKAKTEVRHFCLKHLKNEIHACKTRDRKLPAFPYIPFLETPPKRDTPSELFT